MPKLMAHDPLAESDAILGESFYGRGQRRAPVGAPLPVPSKEKPTHYKIVCISLYNEDISRLEGMVAELKQLGHTKANKSALIRYALASADLTKMPKAY